MSNTLDFYVTPVFEKNLKAFENSRDHCKPLRFIINQGGTRSSKTYSILQLLIWHCLTIPGVKVSVVRKTFPALRDSALADMIDILSVYNLYQTTIKHNKSTNTFNFLNRSSIQFFSVDDAQKVRGRSQDITFINEANELRFDDFQQLNMRTRQKLFIDWNPSDDESWILDISKRDNSILIHSTYLDNTFLEEDQRREIENLINVDETYYEIYCLGLVATRKHKIFNDYIQGEFIDPDNQSVYCVDFGYNDPTALIEINSVDAQPKRKMYIKEHIYESYLTIDLLIEKMERLGIDKMKPMYCDSARPDQIKALQNAGFNAMMAKKAIKEGLDEVKMHTLIIDPDSEYTYKEIKKYTYKIVKDKITDDPIDYDNHAIDAIRYGALGIKAQWFSTEVFVS